MEAMFVDEGFGLDNNSVDDTVSILQCVRQNAGAVVGIISHVGQTIPTKLEVKKGKNGSSIRAQLIRSKEA